MGSKSPPHSELRYGDFSPAGMCPDLAGTQAISYRVADSSIFASQAYSLADFIPGAMTATLDFYGAEFCADLMSRGVKNCAEEVDTALMEGLSIDYVQPFFHYPKTIKRWIEHSAPQSYSEK